MLLIAHVIGTYQIWKFLRFGGSVATSKAGTVYMDWVPDGWSVYNLMNSVQQESLMDKSNEAGKNT